MIKKLITFDLGGVGEVPWDLQTLSRSSVCVGFTKEVY